VINQPGCGSRRASHKTPALRRYRAIYLGRISSSPLDGLNTKASCMCSFERLQDALCFGPRIDRSATARMLRFVRSGPGRPTSGLLNPHRKFESTDFTRPHAGESLELDHRRDLSRHESRTGQSVRRSRADRNLVSRAWDRPCRNGVHCLQRLHTMESTRPAHAHVKMRRIRFTPH